MSRVLLIGIHPDAVDITDPALPPGLTHEAIAAGIEATMADMRSRGWTVGFCAIRPDASLEATLSLALTEGWDCAVIGGGIRIPPSNLLIFERIINTIHQQAPATAMAFNTHPSNSADAAARWLNG